MYYKILLIFAITITILVEWFIILMETLVYLEEEEDILVFLEKEVDILEELVLVMVHILKVFGNWIATA